MIYSNSTLITTQNNVIQHYKVLTFLFHFLLCIIMHVNYFRSLSRLDFPRLRMGINQSFAHSQKFTLKNLQGLCAWWSLPEASIALPGCLNGIVFHLYSCYIDKQADSILKNFVTGLLIGNFTDTFHW